LNNSLKLALLLTPTAKIQLAKELHKTKRGNKCNNDVRFNCKQKGYTLVKASKSAIMA
jgi:hypothetical protein